MSGIESRKPKISEDEKYKRKYFLNMAKGIAGGSAFVWEGIDKYLDELYLEGYVNSTERTRCLVAFTNYVDSLRFKSKEEKIDFINKFCEDFKQQKFNLLTCTSDDLDVFYNIKRNEFIKFLLNQTAEKKISFEDSYGIKRNFYKYLDSIPFKDEKEREILVQQITRDFKRKKIDLLYMRTKKLDERYNIKR